MCRKARYNGKFQPRSQFRPISRSVDICLVSESFVSRPCSSKKGLPALQDELPPVEEMSEFDFIGQLLLKSATELVGTDPNTVPTVQKMRSDVALRQPDDIDEFSIARRGWNRV